MILRLLFIGLWLLPTQQYGQETVRRFIFIGDAGKITSTQTKLISAAEGLVIPNVTIAYFLGDNIYPNGMSLEESHQIESADILHSQYEALRKSGVPVYFMAGNHDWDNSGRGGLAKVKAQEAYIHSLEDAYLNFVPLAGHLRPYVELLTDDIVTVIYDSEFWLFPHHDDHTTEYLSQQKREFQVILTNIAQKYSDKILIIMSHHPMRSYGEHSLRFNAMDHIFPLRKLWRGLYIPIPVLGTIYPILRSTLFRTAEDMKHPLYRELVQSVIAAVGNHNRIIYVSGHDHGLQLIQDGTFTQIVSGSGAKTSDIHTGMDLIYKSGNQGFVVMDVLSNGEVKVSFFIIKNGLIIKDFETSLELAK